jgi:putative antitoxin of VapBC-like toxin-antitoxin system
MEPREETVHTTLNFSKRLLQEMRRLFKDKTNTEVIHEAVEEMVRRAKLEQFVKKYAGKARIRVHG